MKFFVDVEDSNGNKLGAGPLHTVQYWQHTARLSRAGSVQFGMPATDSRWTLPALKRVVRCRAFTGANLLAGWQEMGAGIVDVWNGAAGPGGDVTLEASGDDLLRELTYTHVGALKIATPSSSLAPNSAIWHQPAGTDADLTAGAVTLTTSQYIYVGYHEPFDAWTPTLSVYNTNAATLSAQYYTDNEEAAWKTISVTDGTTTGGATLGQAGSVSWTRPSDWRSTRHGDEDLYWIRFAVSANTTAMTFTANAITGDGPATTGPADIIALAPSGWTLDTTDFYNATATAVVHQFAGETVLEAFVKLAELTGEWFRLGDGREVQWMQTDTPDSGIKAVRHAGDPEMAEVSTHCVIRDLRRVQDSYQAYVGRLYAVADGISLGDTTQTPPSGYAVSSDSRGYYLQHTSTWSSYGIELYMEFSDAQTPDQLYQAALAELQLRQTIYDAYDVEVAGLWEQVKPGDTIRVSYRRIVAGYIAVDLNDDLIILEATTRIDANGIKTTALRLANQPRYPDTAAEVLARLL